MKKYTLKEVDEIGIDNLPDDAVIVLDDRPRKYDYRNDKFVKPGEKGYDELPEGDLYGY